MNVLTYYMVKEILKGSLIALLLLLTLFNLFTFTDELRDLGKGSYGLTEIFCYLALTTPRIFFELMPSAALLGSLFVLGAMANNRELIAMQAAGLPISGIIKAVMAAGTVLVMIAIGVGEFIAPTSERNAQILKISAQHEQVVLHTRYGIWLREGKKFINIREILSEGDLADISIFEIDDKRKLKSIQHIKHASYLGKQQWKLKGMAQSELSTEQIKAIELAEQLWQSTIAPDLLKIAVVNPDNLSVVDLAKYVDFLKENQQKSHIYEQAFWGRVFNPLITFVMLMLATPLVIGVKRGIGVGPRMMMGVIIGLGFNLIDRIVSHLGLIYDYNPVLIAVLPSVTVLILVGFFAKKVQSVI